MEWSGNKALHQLVPAKISKVTFIHTPSSLFSSHFDPLGVSWGQNTNSHLYPFDFPIIGMPFPAPFLIWKATNYF